jgi:N utilization substance protein A
MPDNFLDSPFAELFANESPEVAQGVVEIKAIAREPGSRSKIAVWSNDGHIDPVGSLVGQRGVRVSTVMSELAGEKIDVIEWSETPEHFIEDALSPAKVLEVVLSDPESRSAIVRVTEDQQSLAIGRGGQNVRLAAKLTGWRIDIQSAAGDELSEAAPDEEIEHVATQMADAVIASAQNSPEGETPDTPEKPAETAPPEENTETKKDGE